MSIIVNRLGWLTLGVLLLAVAHGCADKHASVGYDIEAGGADHAAPLAADGAGGALGQAGETTPDAGNQGSSEPAECASGEVQFFGYAIDVENECMLSERQVLGCGQRAEQNVSPGSESPRCLQRASDGMRFATWVRNSVSPSQGTWSECDTRVRFNCDFVECRFGAPSFCSREATCALVGCGSSSDWADALGCLRAPCGATVPCDGGDRCQRISKSHDLMPPGTHCVPKVVDGTCACFNGLTGGTNYIDVCVPQ